MTPDGIGLVSACPDISSNVLASISVLNSSTIAAFHCFASEDCSASLRDGSSCAVISSGIARLFLNLRLYPCWRLGPSGYASLFSGEMRA